METSERRREGAVAAAYLLVLLVVVGAARAGVFPGTGEAFEGSLFHHPYRLSMAVSGTVLAVILGAGSAWFGARRQRMVWGLIALVAGGFVTGAALSFSPYILFPGDQYPVSFGWLIGGAPVAAVMWLAGTLLLRRRGSVSSLRATPSA